MDEPSQDPTPQERRRRTPVERVFTAFGSGSMPAAGPKYSKDCFDSYYNIKASSKLAELARTKRSDIVKLLADLETPWCHRKIEDGERTFDYQPIKDLFLPFQIEVVMIYNPVVRGEAWEEGIESETWEEGVEDEEWCQDEKTFEETAIESSDYGELPGIGIGIGCSGVVPTSGTNGGYIYITKEGKRDLYLLSCHHVLFPRISDAENQEYKEFPHLKRLLKNWSELPGKIILDDEIQKLKQRNCENHLKDPKIASNYHPWSMTTYHEVCMPSEADHILYLYDPGDSAQHIQEEIEKMSSELVSETWVDFKMADQNIFFERSKLGQKFERRIAGVCYGSGLNSVESDTIHDLALARVYEKYLPRCANYIHPRYNGPLSLRAVFQRGKAITEYAEPVSGEDAAYIGRSSGLVWGRVLSPDHPSSIRCNISYTGVDTDEWTFECKTWHAFVRGRDTGAWIFNTKGQVIGRLFARHTELRVGYFTPFSRDVSRIEAITGGTVSLPSAEETLQKIEHLGRQVAGRFNQGQV